MKGWNGVIAKGKGEKRREKGKDETRKERECKMTREERGKESRKEKQRREAENRLPGAGPGRPRNRPPVRGPKKSAGVLCFWERKKENEQGAAETRPGRDVPGTDPQSSPIKALNSISRSRH